MLNKHPLCANITHIFYINISSLDHLSNTSHQILVRYFMSIFCFAISTLHIMVSATTFFKLHSNKRVAWINNRSVLPVIMISLALLFQVIITSFPGFSFPLPTWIGLPMAMLIIPFLAAPIPLRLLDFYARYVFTRVITQMNIYQNSEFDSDLLPSEEFLNSNDPSTSMKSVAEDFLSSQRSGVAPSLNRKHESTQKLRQLKLFASSRFQLLVVIIGSIPLIIVLIIHYLMIPELAPVANCVDVRPLSIYYFIIITYGVISVIAGIRAVFMVKEFSDPFNMVHEVKLYVMYGGSISVLSFILGSFVSNVPISFTFNYFLTAGMNIMLATLTDYQIYLAVVERFGEFSFKNLLSMIGERFERKKKNIVKASTLASIYVATFVIEDPFSNISQGKRELLQALNDPTFIEDFEKYLIGEFSAENLRMYVESRKWEEMYFDATDSRRRARAKKIFEIFADVGAIFEVNLSDDIRFDIERRLVNKNYNLPQKLFARSQNEVIGMMYDPYQRYLRHKQPIT